MRIIKFLSHSLVLALTLAPIFATASSQLVLAKYYAFDITSNAPARSFVDSNWGLRVYRTGSSYTYSLKNFKTEKYFELKRGRLTKVNGKHYYRWHNRGTIYQVTWNPRDPDYARVEAFQQGKQVFNQLLKQDESGV